jgi:hypothetical protein
MTDGFPLTSALAATIAERRVITPAGGVRMSAVLLTLKTTGGAISGVAGLEDALRVYLREAPAKARSAISDHAMSRFIVVLRQIEMSS